MSTRKFSSSGRERKEDPGAGEEMKMPINPSYFSKLPKGVDPVAWLRLKVALVYKMPPTPVLSEYPVSFDDRFWSISTVPVKQRDGTDKIMYILMYNYKTRQDEDGISASLIFNQVPVKSAKSGKAYDIVNVKYATFDAEISENVNIRIIPNPF
jgi:hypothetical protein